MTTVIRATGVQFSNANLPSLSPIYDDGLVALFRPSNKAGALSDVYNISNQLTAVGSPQLTDVGATVSLRNYLQSNVPETKNMTLMAVAKVTNTPGVAIVGNFATGKGSSMWFDHANNQTRIKAQTFATSDAPKNRVFTSGSTVNVGQYVFVCLVINADSNSMQFYIPALGDEQTYSEPVAGGINARNLSGNIKIGSADNVGFAGTANVVEAIIYNKALTKSQVMTQYMYSKDYFAKLGIVI